MALEPRLAAGILDVGELDADLAAVGGAQRLEDLAERLHRTAGQIAGEERALEVVVAEAVVRRIEFGEVLRAAAERVDVRDAMSARAVRVDQPQRTRVLLGLAAIEPDGRRGSHRIASAQAGSTEPGSLAKRSRISSTAAALMPKSARSPLCPFGF